VQSYKTELVGLAINGVREPLSFFTKARYDEVSFSWCKQPRAGYPSQAIAIHVHIGQRVSDASYANPILGIKQDPADELLVLMICKHEVWTSFCRDSAGHDTRRGERLLAVKAPAAALAVLGPPELAGRNLRQDGVPKGSILGQPRWTKHTFKMIYNPEQTVEFK